MKKIIFTFAIIAGLAFTSNAQKKQSHHQKPEFTVEQQTTLAVKKLTIALDLTESQQEKMRPLLLVVTTNRQKMMDERKTNEGKAAEISNKKLYEKMIAKMDQQISYQTAVKKVLNKDQYADWKKIQVHMHKDHSSKKSQAKKGGHKGKTANS